MKKFGLLISFLLLTTQLTWGQIFNENFDYGISDNADITTVSTWVRHSGVQGPQYSATGLSYTGYASSAIGGAISFTNGSSGINDGDVNRNFTEVNTTNNIYVSFLLNVSSALATQDYFIHVGPTLMGTAFRGRVYARTNSTGWSLSLSKTGTPIVQDNTVLSFNQTYLVVLKYIFSTATTTDDQIGLYVYDSGLPASEPGSPIVNMALTGDGVTDGVTNIGTVAIRQGSTTPTAKIDGIRIATSWSEAPLPVELTSFSATTIGSTVKLSWQTATEVNNFGFDVERKSNVKGQTSDGWTKLGFVNGNGNSNSPKNYSFVDDNVTAGTYSYRLKQIDNDGQFEYSKAIEIGLTAPDKFELSQNYPNPFNPSTTISYNLPEATNVKLIIFNILGQEVKTLINGFKEAGVHSVNFNASELNSGLYIYKIEAGSFTQTRKMTLIK